MIVAHTPRRAHKRLKPLIDFARKEGWAVVRTPGGHLTFTKSGLPPIYTGSVAGNLLAYRNARAQLRLNERTAGTSAMTREAGRDG